MATDQNKQRAVEAAQNVSDFANTMSRDDETFVETLNRQHRTIQQCFTGLCFAWIKHCAKQAETGDFDGRNEYSVKKCQEIVEKVEIFRPPFS